MSENLSSIIDGLKAEGKFSAGSLFAYSKTVRTVIVVAANTTLRRNGSLVMRRGGAQYLTQKFPQIEQLAGLVVGGIDNQGVFGGASGIEKFCERRYGFIVLELVPEFTLGIIQDRLHYSSKPRLDIAEYSLGKLSAFALEHPEYRIKTELDSFGHFHHREILPILLGTPKNIAYYRS